MIVYEDKGSTGVSQVALWLRLAAEFLGSAFLAAPVIGSGIAAQRPWSSGWPARTATGATAGSMENWPGWG